MKKLIYEICQEPSCNKVAKHRCSSRDLFDNECLKLTCDDHVCICVRGVKERI